MTDDLQPPELLAVGPEHREVLVALLDDYLGELSAHRESPVGARTASEYRDLDGYFGEPGRHAFLLSAHGEVAGFALIRGLIRGPASTGGEWHVAEFYVAPRHRRSGLGRRMMTSIWARFPGRWELQIHARNTAAVAFWESCTRASAEGEPIVTPIEAPDGRRLEYGFCVAPRAVDP